MVVVLVELVVELLVELLVVLVVVVLVVGANLGSPQKQMRLRSLFESRSMASQSAGTPLEN